MSSLQPPPQPKPPETISHPVKAEDVATTGRTPRVYVAPKPPPQPVRPRRRRWRLYGVVGALVLALAAGFFLLYPRFSASPPVILPEVGPQTTPSASAVPSPTPYTVDQLRVVAAAALDRCMNEQMLFTSCGFGWGGLKDGAAPDLRTLHWRYHAGSANTLRQAGFVILPTSGSTTSTAPIHIMLDIDVYDTAGVHYIDWLTLTQASVDFSDPAAPVVTITGGK